MQLFFEGFSADQEMMIRQDYNRMLELAPRTLDNNANMATWFGAANRNIVVLNLLRMATVLTETHRSIRFVNRTGPNAVLRVEYKNIYSATLHAPDQEPARLNPGTYAYVFPTDRRDEGHGKSGPLTHTGSGMRLFLCGNYFTDSDIGRAATIYHELTHKVIATEDFVYEAGPCQNLPDGKKIRNADNYALYLADLA